VSVRRGEQGSVGQRAGALLRSAVASGTRGMRAHVDVAPVYGLSNLTGVRAAAAQLAAAIDVQVVAFPQLGVMRTPGTAAVMRDAMAAGADLVGGLDPWTVDSDATGQLAVLAQLAHEFDAGIDLHLHDDGVAGADMVQQLAQWAASEGLRGRLTLSHAFALGDVDAPTLAALMDALLDAEVHLATCAHGDAPLLPLAELRVAGVPVALGTDGIRDPWSPFGTPDLLDRVWLQAFLGGVSSDAELIEALTLATSAGDGYVGLEPSRFEIGDPADLMLVAGETVGQFVIDRPVRSLVLRRGEVVARDGRCVVDQA